jgi:malate dehydrogenase (oxaloacetate-decarboxylating)(NADP+)
VAGILQGLKREVSAIVVTDGERILGLGDLGANGMGIPIGKLALCTAVAGVPPRGCLPVTLDVGTNNAKLQNDSEYIGDRHERATGEEYAAFVDEFIMASDKLFDAPLIQFEDFETENAFVLLERYRERVCCFNDDIQGTAAVVLAGLLAASRVTKQQLSEGTYVFLGAGEASIGTADLLVAEMASQGASEREVKSRVFLVDSKGLVVTSRTDLSSHKRRYAHDRAPIADFGEIVDSVKPTALIGASAVPNVFSPAIIARMAALDERPVIFALSNPTDRSECTAQEAFEHSGGRALFASGSPFPPVSKGGKEWVPGQCNNSYISFNWSCGDVCASDARVAGAFSRCGANPRRYRVTGGPRVVVSLSSIV